MKKDFLTLSDFSSEEIHAFFKLSTDIKKNPSKYSSVLKGKTLAMIFMKNSTRTRVSFETGAFQLGGSAIFLSANDIQLSRGETIHDTAKVLSRYVDGIMIRTFANNDVVEFAKHSSIPVINGLTDLLHPCQAFTDYFSILEKKGRLEGLTIVYIGDGNNMANSLSLGASKVGMNIKIISPEDFTPDIEILKLAEEESSKRGTKITITDDINEVRGADVIYTDTWASMGQEKEALERKKVFSKYRVNSKVMEMAGPDAIFMHCLPAHRGEEVTDEVIDSSASIVFDEAENRLHCQKAIMAVLMGGVSQ